MTETRLVVRDGISFEAVSEIAEQLRWRPARRSPDAVEWHDFPEFTWRGDRGTVTFVEDVGLGLSFFIVDTPDPAKTEADIRQRAPCYRPGEIVDAVRAAGSPSEMASALKLVAAVAFPHFDPVIYEAVVRGLADPETSGEAISAAGELGWRQLRPPLEDLLERTEAESRRAYISNVLNLTLWERG